MGWLRTTKVAFVATRLGIGYNVCCNGYMDRLRTTRVRYSGWLGTTKMTFVLTLVGLRYTECCDATWVVWIPLATGIC